jgi:hypothetical protein
VTQVEDAASAAAAASGTNHILRKNIFRIPPPPNSMFI